MSTRRKLPHSRVPIVNGAGLLAKEWQLLMEREEHIGPAATSATAGGASALPATPEGFITTTVNGVIVLVPYYLP